MFKAQPMTSSQARETIDRLIVQTGPLRAYAVAPEALIEEYNDSLVAFVPRDKMQLFHIGKQHYVGDTTLPGAFVPIVLFRDHVRRAQTDFETLLGERQRQPANH
jgi:hypothetical protein